MKPDPADRNFTRVETSTRETSAAVRVAIFVAHGMGQQVAFETLDGVATALREEHARVRHTKPDVAVRQVRNGDAHVPRAEVMLDGDSGRPHAVHLYEAYWAPLTEGQITTAETFWFLCTSAFQGVLHAFRGRFWRYLFGRRQSFRVSRRTAGAFLLAIAFVASLAVMNAVIVACLASRTLAGGGARWPSGPMLVDLTTDFAVFVLVAIVAGFIGVVWPLLRRRRRPDGTWSVPSANTVGICWGFVALAIVTTIVSGVLVATHVIRHSSPYAARFWQGTFFDGWFAGLLSDPVPGWTLARTIVIWAVVIAASWFVRQFVVQYVGDVAIYVTAHRVNRFYQTRQVIQERGKKIAEFIYGLAVEGSPRRYYDRVIVVGHSLGSVLAYDTLNAMIRDDADRPAPLGVVERTSMLLTLGSPLDKTAFIFRTQRDDRSEVREALAATVQPLIQRYAYRPARWINLWSPNDLIGAALHFYDEAPPGPDDTAETPAPDLANPKRVVNLADDEATTPLGAHSEHWTGRLFAKTLFAEATRTT